MIRTTPDTYPVAGLCATLRQRVPSSAEHGTHPNAFCATIILSLLRRLLILALPVCGFLVPLGMGTPAQAFHPKSPEVQAMVKKAIRFLTKEDYFSREERVLAAMALLKAGEPSTHPVVEAARKDCLEWCASDSMIEGALDSIYEVAVVGLFFCELDPSQYKNQIQRLTRALEKRQKDFGGWGYPKPSGDWKTGDTSMTQYVVLYAWTAEASGADEMSSEAIRKVTNWLLRTQDPSGAWGYQGNDPGSFQRVKQTEVRHSLAAAGAGSLYICSGMLGFTQDQVDVVQDDELPPALKLITNEPSTTQVADDVIDSDILRRGIRDGDRWFSKNYRINPTEYTLYYLYTLERYQSFRDAAEGRVKKQPGWYNDGVRLLRKNQQRDGRWDFDHGNGKVVDTSFGILFLVRSTQKTLAKLDEDFAGLLVAGRGIPTGDIKMKAGQIVRSAFEGSTSSLLEILEDAAHPDFDSVENLTLPIANDPRALKTQQERLRRLVKAEAYNSRIVAVRTLGKIHDLDNVPILIYALSDPDVRVAKVARDGLRFISRKFAGFGMPDEPTAAERDAAIEQWKAWYLDLRPNARFED